MVDIGHLPGGWFPFGRRMPILGSSIEVVRLPDPTQPSTTPAFLQHDRPPVPDIVVPRGVLPFHLENQPVRGRLVRLGSLADAIIGRHPALHPAVKRLLGEALALTAGLAAALKYRGSFSMQAKGDGIVSMLLADCTDDGALRGYARVDEAELEKLLPYDPDPSAAALLGKGYLAFTCDQGPEMERYQGIVAIEGITLAQMTASYFRASEQLKAQVQLACAETPQGWRASALILEKVAGEGGLAPEGRGEHYQVPDAEADEESWRTAVALAGTLTTAEILDDGLSSAQLLHRLFALEGLKQGQARALAYGCRCSRAKLAGVLGGFGTDDLDHMAEDGCITMTCEFCNIGFRFNRAEVQGAG